ncbi:MAG: S41 family peptidase [Terriglobia bacterium]
MKKSGRLVAIIALVVLLVTGSFLGGFLVSQRVGLGAAHPSFSVDVVDEVFNKIRLNYVDKVSESKLKQGAVQGMIEALDDPYSQYLSSSEFKSLQEQTQGHFFGVGIEIGVRDERIVVVSPIKGTPAEEAGIRAEDQITAVDGKSIEGQKIEQVVKQIRGPKGSPVVLTIERKGEDEPLKFRLVRAEISIPNLSSEIIDKDMGYIFLHTFNGGATTDLKKAVTELAGEGAKGFILDLRNNPGGSLEEAIGVASVFIDSGPIVKIKNRKGKIRSELARGQADRDTPLVVLVNKGSASASEIVAGAIQDTKRGTLVGEKTFGKGSVQTVISLRNDSGLIITTDAYLTPKGRQVNKKGITPDTKVSLEEGTAFAGDADAQLNRAKLILRDKI